ncbi:hypothetical protein [Dyella caseinilytica]|uniref:Uncharacterized protein n=1 Tax=Dyella caseinilytica TaxID=1849581 RepID=A0ABX7GT56_9GAMM|nr:hypothetical protein [Dyella caseinilytica]QRN53233.1 hypothetical protein ISN74_17640 [Dyella caseinilytica]
MPALIDVPVVPMDVEDGCTRWLAGGWLGEVGMANMLNEQAVFVHN